LIIAAKGRTSRHTACVRYLIESGCEVDVVDFIGRSALRQAILASNVESVELLLQYDCNLSWNEHTTLHPKHISDPVALSFAYSIQRCQEMLIITSLVPGSIRKYVSSYEKIIQLLLQELSV
jgi:hypothetical protein